MIEKEKINLDDPAVYKLYDAEGMLDHVHNFPSLCEKAWRMTMDFKLPSYNGGIKNVVILGMGGSAIGGDLVGSLASSESRIPVSVCRGYDLPPYVDSGTLVIASSYSGATEETLSAFQQAIATPAKKLAVTTGGKLKDLCDSKGIPVFAIDYQTQPRAALPFSFFMILGLLQKLGILSDKTGEVKETIVNLNGLAVKINEKVASSQNMAKRLASMLYGRLAVIYGAGITAEAAHRWKTQINENSKSMAFYEILPELDHNAIVGYSLPPEITHQTMVVLLDSALLHDRIRLRYEVTQKLLEQAGIFHQVLHGEGKSALSQMMTLVLFGDYVSYYLAILNRTDPTPVKVIEFLKKSLAEK